ncbi:MAG: hypothetical protein L6R37_002287 [Teloschistes peruensis]|nr:MAG: hypothetical protein L6R37_002287 [Teloschistes peruensis]
MSHPSTNLNSATPTHGSQTLLQSPALPEPLPTLRLRAEGTATARPRIRWAEDVVDNEGLGRKRSKVCCIYHPPGEIGESSSSDSSGSSSSSNDSDFSNDDGGARMTNSQRGKRRKDNGHQHNEEGCAEDHGAEGGVPSRARRRNGGRGSGGGGNGGGNAYEHQPKAKAKAKSQHKSSSTGTGGNDAREGAKA